MRQPITNWNLQPLGLFSDEVIARNLGCARQTVSLQRSHRNIPPFIPPKQHDPFALRVEKIIAMRVLGKTFAEIGETMGVSRQMVWSILKRNERKQKRRIKKIEIEELVGRSKQEGLLI